MQKTLIIRPWLGWKISQSSKVQKFHNRKRISPFFWPVKGGSLSSSLTSRRRPPLCADNLYKCAIFFNKLVIIGLQRSSNRYWKVVFVVLAGWSLSAGRMVFVFWQDGLCLLEGWSLSAGWCTLKTIQLTKIKSIILYSVFSKGREFMFVINLLSI